MDPATARDAGRCHIIEGTLVMRLPGRRGLFALLLLFAVHLAACDAQQGGEPTATTSPSLAPAASSTTVSPPPTSLPATTTLPAATTPPGPESLEIRPDGLGDGYPLFGPAQPVVDALTVLWGPPAAADPLAETCPSGANQVVRWDQGFIVLYDDVLNGYTVQDSSITTASGLGVGSTLADLRAEYGVRLSAQETTLGIEWWVEFDGDLAIRGFATGLEDESTVSAIGAADLCAFR